MKIEQINSHYSVSGQIAIEDLQVLSDHGVEVLICNRPDGESSEQTNFQTIREVADKLGIVTHLIDFAPNKLTDEKSSEFAAIISSNKKTHAYCGTGARAKAIYEGV